MQRHRRRVTLNMLALGFLGLYLVSVPARRLYSRTQSAFLTRASSVSVFHYQRLHLASLACASSFLTSSFAIAYANPCNTGDSQERYAHTSGKHAATASRLSLRRADDIVGAAREISEARAHADSQLLADRWRDMAWVR